VFPSGQAIHIKSDGSIDPPTAPIQKNGDLYFLTDDITADSAGIAIERDNITLNGMGHLIQPHPHIVGKYGIDLTSRNNVTIENVRTKSFTFHVGLLNSEGNHIKKNSFIGSEYPAALLEELATIEVGIYLSHSSNNTISQNEVTNTYGAVLLSYSINSKIYHNNFISTHIPVEADLDSVNTWDDGYPSGGNYWSDYTDVDKCRGPDQNKTGGDYIWDRPYAIDSNNQDHYPLVNKWSVADVSHDGEIDIIDAAAISAHWYPGPPVGPLGFDTSSDINGDGSIDFLDAALVSSYWTGPPKGPLAP
jgi:parallel beta-helix repeat protein